MVVQRRNDQKVVGCVHAKAQPKWDKLVIVAKECSPLPKPTLVKLILEQLLMIRSQIANLTIDPSFGHNLCFRNSNGSCKFIFRHLCSKSFSMI